MKFSLLWLNSDDFVCRQPRVLWAERNVAVNRTENGL